MDRSLEADGEVVAVVTASLVTDEKRMDTLPHFFGSKLTRAEMLVYQWMGTLCPSYAGGYWHFYRLSNGGFYMAPTGEDSFVVTVSNDYQGTMSADAAGVTACLFAFNQLANTQGPEQERFIELFYQLRDFAASHQEAREIFRAID